MDRGAVMMRPRRSIVGRLTRGVVRRTGMTLVEVIIAMLLMVSVILVLGGFMTKFSQATGQARLVVQANELASARLDAVRQQPSYTSIDTLAHTDTVKSDFTTYTLKTQIVHIGGAPTDSLDYKMVTVTVTQPYMKKVVTKSTAVAAF